MSKKEPESENMGETQGCSPQGWCLGFKKLAGIPPMESLPILTFPEWTECYKGNLKMGSGKGSYCKDMVSPVQRWEGRWGPSDTKSLQHEAVPPHLQPCPTMPENWVMLGLLLAQYSQVTPGSVRDLIMLELNV